MKFAIFTVSMPEYDLEQTAAKIREFGYDGIEWRVTKALTEAPNPPPPFERRYWGYNKSTVDEATILENIDYIKQLSAKNNLEMCALGSYLTANDPVEKVENVIKAASLLGCPQIRVNASGYNPETQNYREVYKTCVENYGAFVDLAKKYNVRINVEMHHGTITPSASAAYRFVSNFDSKYVGVIYDTGNMVHEGYEQYKMGLEILGEYLGHVHVKNTQWVKGEDNQFGLTEWKSEWAPMRKGIANLKVFFDTLKTVGYDGYISVEDFSNDMPTDEKLKDNLAFLKSLL